MARLPRYVLPGQPQHVIQRGVNRSPTFFCDDDYHFYRACLREACVKHDCAVHAYVLMANHVHLLMTPNSPAAISKVMQSVGRRYVQYVNHTHRRTGTLWEGRYKATLIDSDQYLLTCYRYIELNPVRAHIVKDPAEYLWSSYHAHARGHCDAVVEDHPLYVSLGRNTKVRQRTYRSLFDKSLDDVTLNRIRDATNKAWVLGDDRFQRAVEPVLQRRTQPLPRGGVRLPEPA